MPMERNSQEQNAQGLVVTNTRSSNEWYSQRRVTSSSGGGAAALDGVVPSSLINEHAFVMSIGPPASVSMASAAHSA